MSPSRKKPRCERCGAARSALYPLRDTVSGLVLYVCRPEGRKGVAEGAKRSCYDLLEAQRFVRDTDLEPMKAL